MVLCVPFYITVWLQFTYLKHEKVFLKAMPNSVLLTMKFILSSVSRFGVKNKILLTDFLYLFNTHEQRFHVSGRSLTKATELQICIPALCFTEYCCKVSNVTLSIILRLQRKLEYIQYFPQSFENLFQKLIKCSFKKSKDLQLLISFQFF